MRINKLLLSMVVVALLVGPAFADDFTWADANDYTGGAWETGTNWVGDPAAGPNALDANAILPQPGDPNAADKNPQPVTVTVTGPKLLQSLTFDGPSSVNVRGISYTVDAATDPATDTLTFADGGHITHAEFHTWSVVKQRINNNIIMQGDLTINNNWNGGNKTEFGIYGTITGSGTLTLESTHKPDGGSGTGRLDLHGNSSATFTGDVVINSGQVQLYPGSLGDTVGITTLNQGSIMGATAENITVTGILGTKRCAYESYGGDRAYSGTTTLVGGATIELNPGGNQLTTGSNVNGTAIVGEGNVLVTGWGNSSNRLQYGRIDMEGVNTYTGKLTIVKTGNDGRANSGPLLRLQGELSNSNIEILNGSMLHGDTVNNTLTPTIHFSDGDTITLIGYPEILNDPDPPTPAVNSIFDTELIKWDLMGLTAAPGATVTLVDYSSDGEFVLGATLLDDVLTAESTTAGWVLTNDLELSLVTGALAGLPDADGNGVVNAADYIALKRHMGTPSGATLAMGDFDGDDDVDFDDLQVLIDNYDATSASSPVPEPATLFVMMAAGLPALLKRRQRRS